MIALEIKDIKKEKEAIISYRKIAFKYINIYEEKSTHHLDLIDNIKNQLFNKNNFTEKFRQTDNIFEQSVISGLNIIALNPKKTSISLHKKNTTYDKNKGLYEKVDEMTEFYEKLKATIKDISPNFVQSAEFQSFKEMNEKNVELRVHIIIFIIFYYYIICRRHY